MKHTKHFLFALLAALFVVLPASPQAAEPAAHKHQTAIQTCVDCAAACEICATACLRDTEIKAMSACIQLDRDCADLCALCARLMARDSSSAKALCAVCATACDACAEECAKHKSPDCVKCAEACRKCAEECRKMAK